MLANSDYGSPVAWLFRIIPIVLVVLFVVMNSSEDKKYSGCYFPWSIGGLFQQHSYIVSRDDFDIKFGVGFLGQWLTVGPGYQIAHINLDPNGWLQEGSI